MTNLWIATVSAAALLASATIVGAQPTPGGGGGPGGAGAPGAGGAGPKDDGGPTMQKQAPGKGATSESKGDAPSGKSTKGGDGKGSAPTKSAAPKSDDDGNQKSTPKKSAEPKSGDDTKQKGAPKKSAEPQGDSKQKSASPKSGEPGAKSKEPSSKAAEPGTKATEPAPKSAQPSTPADKGKAGQDKAAAPGQAPGQAVQLSDSQRTTIREHVSRERTDRVNVNVNVRVGVTIPRSVRLLALPAVLIADVPAYRDYRYVVIEDSICIVDPATYVIVEVIDLRSERAGGSDRATRLVLSGDQRRFVYERLADDRGARVELRIRLALGAEVPRSVVLHPFPQPVIERVPELRRFRYVVAEEQVIVVDPDSYDIVLLVSQ